MRRVNIIVEGQTEETFVRDFLAPHLGQFNVGACARRVETSRQRIGIFRGGMTNYLKAKNDINQWLKQDKEAFVSTMFDLYALPNDFPGMAGNYPDGHTKANSVEAAMFVDIGDQRFIPYIQVHEFEALIFSDAKKIDEVIPASRAGGLLAVERAKYSTPEHINEGPLTAPSKRIINACAAYKKVLYGTRITSKIGMAVMMQQCHHFAQWIDKLKTLGVEVTT